MIQPGVAPLFPFVSLNKLGCSEVTLLRVLLISSPAVGMETLSHCPIWMVVMVGGEFGDTAFIAL